MLVTYFNFEINLDLYVEYRTSTILGGLNGLNKYKRSYFTSTSIVGG